MTIEQLKDTYERQPFRPFIIHLADGRQIPVNSREFMLTVPSGRTIVVAQPDDRLHIIDFLMITDLEIKTRSIGAGKRRPE